MFSNNFASFDLLFAVVDSERSLIFKELCILSKIWKIHLFDSLLYIHGKQLSNVGMVTCIIMCEHETLCEYLMDLSGEDAFEEDLSFKPNPCRGKQGFNMDMMMML